MPVFIPAIPAAAASLGFIGSFLAGLAGSLTAFFAKYLTKKLAITAGALTAIAAVTTAFWLAIKSSIAAIGLITPPFFNEAMAFIVPWNLEVCISLIIAARVMRYVYEWKVYAIHLHATS